ncbi:MAG: hypothetical protein A3H59_01570 [Candidatus Jacksonbacteria bacterium RIFCSPLOWO2_02_FULL_43_9]|nr:MAG: hypothetical protein UV70_C0004G0038 [Parcubacteria group bacterium GW2011_GWA2_43_13]OGY70147.1 MAG: hypothetical protein A2986_03525 [Candidatus Jacksonbacteria bacterium RIFCSPLOWO2_01_FULL_44_13]OGY73497.1 MAG: hypothetical protein A3H59_01570 [Candidatus Jacksonbacteria bacterium RIFCSPLOWO2_02_FULL_43_9]HAZ16484.1 hypothetical protein [Candidatus Jacksonbacteria bacterium]
MNSVLKYTRLSFILLLFFILLYSVAPVLAQGGKCKKEKDGPDPAKLQIYIPGVTDEAYVCATGKVGAECHKANAGTENDTACEKEVNGVKIKGICVQQAQINIDADNPAGGAVDYISKLYKFFVILAAMASVLMLAVAGYRWMFAGGNSGAVDKAKETMRSALAGLLIALFSFTILKIINPELVDLSLPNVAKNLTPIECIEQDWATANQVERNLDLQCPPDIKVLSPSNRAATGDATVCGSMYTIVGFDLLSQDLQQRFPSKQCYGRVCYKGLQEGQYIQAGVTSEATKDTCNPKTDTIGFECSGKALGFGQNVGQNIMAKDICKEVKCTTTDSQKTCEQKCATKNDLTFRASGGSLICTAAEVMELSPGGKVLQGTGQYTCDIAEVRNCGVGEVRLDCAGKDTIPAPYTISLGLEGFESTDTKRPVGYECMIENQTPIARCSEEQIAGGDYGVGICCAVLDKRREQTDVSARLIKNGIDCRGGGTPQCHSNEVKVDCSVWNDVAGGYESIWKSGKPKERCESPDICCLQIEQK